ncbi:MAG TPA: hypothetical protein VLL54_21005 [Pyrinomonadaceae bacterium]|nr:hypothetical protein [Pyrinomonadaceae bacterium]
MQEYQRPNGQNIKTIDPSYLIKISRRLAHKLCLRLKEAFSGAEARGEAATNDRPYKETFAYDGFSHLTNRQSNSWNDSYSMTPDSYSSNRRDGWNYDAEGNLFASTDLTYSYDAAGEIRTAGTSQPQSTTTRGLDGDGQQVRTVESTYDETSQTWTSVTVYYLHSTVLGGQVLTEVNESGSKTRSFVYAGGSVLATQQVYANGTQDVAWEYRDPSNATYRTTYLNGATRDRSELDATNADAGIHAPLISPPPTSEGGDSLGSYGSFMDVRGGLTKAYRSDGMAITAEQFMLEVDARFHGSFLEIAGFFARKQTAEVKSRIPDLDPVWSTPETTVYNDGWNFAFPFLPQNPGLQSPTPAPTPQISAACQAALTVANQDINAIVRANAEAETLRKVGEATHMYPEILAAIGVRETGFQNVNQAGGNGRGIFQLDIGANPQLAGIAGTTKEGDVRL